MNVQKIGNIISELREDKGMTQAQLAQRLNVSDKAISKWETGRGYPDISLVEQLADALGVSIIELFNGEDVVNTNKSFNMMRMKLHVCPICGNIITSIGEAVVSCCGIVLPPLEPEAEDENHHLVLEKVEDEYYVTIPHEMSKKHYISFIVAVKDDGVEMKKLYAEGDAEACFKISRTRYLLYYCNLHGLFKVRVKTK